LIDLIVSKDSLDVIVRSCNQLDEQVLQINFIMPPRQTEPDCRFQRDVASRI
jgi:hypothetical protein